MHLVSSSIMFEKLCTSKLFLLVGEILLMNEGVDCSTKKRLDLLRPKVKFREILQFFES